jgi:hypothetical protein
MNLREYVSHNLPKPQIKIEASSVVTRELVEAQLKRDDLPQDERKYLEDLLARKYS